MADETAISWTATDGKPGATFNPWLGCQRVSPGCQHCYAETFVTRRMGLPVWGPSTTTERKRTAPSNWKKPLAWNRTAQREGRRIKVFCSSLADVFEDNPQVAPWRRELFQMIEQTTHLDWLLLTKRPEHMRRLAVEAGWPSVWPAHVWAGTTVEDKRRAEERIPHLLQVPARIRFLSCEPLLEAVNLTDTPANLPRLSGEYDDDYFDALAGRGNELQEEGHTDTEYPRLSWIICGGESGPGARPFDLGWARSLRDQCGAAGVPFFMKQMGANPIDSGVRDIVSPDGKAICQRPVGHPDIEEALRSGGYSVRPGKPRYKDKAGADPSEWPEPMRVQEFPR